MRLSSNNYFSIGGAQALQNVRKRATGDIRPSEATLSSSKNTVSLQRRQDGPSIEVKKRADINSNPFVDSDAETRKIRTEGIGDRAFSLTNSTPVETPKLYPFSTNDSTLSNTEEAPSEYEAQTVRGAIVQISNNFTRENSNPDLEDLKSEIDARLGSGLADLFKVRLSDEGNGISAISVSQVEYQDLDVTEKETFRNAVASVQETFGEIPSERKLEGSDIDQKLLDLESVLGMSGRPLVADLRKALSESSDVQASLEDFQTRATDLGLSEGQQAAVNSLVDDLKVADANVTSSFDANALADDFKITFSSHRYGQAFSPSSIAANAALTANTIFLGK